MRHKKIIAGHRHVKIGNRVLKVPTFNRRVTPRMGALISRLRKAVSAPS